MLCTIDRRTPPDGAPCVDRAGRPVPATAAPRASTGVQAARPAGGGSLQAPGAVVLVRARCFQPNPQTARDNAFQRCARAPAIPNVAESAFEESTRAAQTLQAHGVRVHLFDDDGSNHTPDSVFPNNWFSTHAGGHVAIYPMYAPNRRLERRNDIIDMLQREYRVQDVIDYSGLVHDGVFLEGTGAMVLDHEARVAYTARSHRADPIAVERFCTHFNYEPMVFDTCGPDGRSVYHTNVLMTVATEFALVGSSLISDPGRRAAVHNRLEQSGRHVIEIDPAQVSEFAGNAMELSGHDGRLLAISTRALASLRASQRRVIERSARIVTLSVPTIEQAGGSVRCMLAGVHLSRR